MDDARMQSSIAVVMATCQGERFIAAQLASLANQTRRPDRLVVSDDCSTDATPSLVEAFAVNAPFPVAIHRNQRRLGYTCNFISATRRTDADIILFADQDDIWLPGKVAAVGEALETGRDLVIGHDIALIDAEGQMLVPSDFRRWTTSSPAGVALHQGLLARVSARVNFELGMARAAIRRLPRPLDREPRDGGRPARRAGPGVLVEHRLHGANASGWFVRP